MFCISPAPRHLRKFGAWIVYDGGSGTVLACGLSKAQARALVEDLATGSPQLCRERAALQSRQIRSTADDLIRAFGAGATATHICAKIPGVGHCEAEVALAEERRQYRVRKPAKSDQPIPRASGRNR